MQATFITLVICIIGGCVSMSYIQSVDSPYANSDGSVGNLQTLIDAAEQNTTFLRKSRQRRYVVFPEGSTFTVAAGFKVAACVSFKALTGADPGIFTEGVNWSLSYDLPNETRHDEKKKLVPITRHKRDLYQRIEILMSSAGFDGRSCVLRTICETAQLIPPRQGVIQEIIRILFTYEIEAQSIYGRNKHTRYGAAHNHGVTDNNCYDLYPCPISLLDLLLQFGVKQQPNTL